MEDRLRDQPAPWFYARESWLLGEARLSTRVTPSPCLELLSINNSPWLFLHPACVPDSSPAACLTSPDGWLISFWNLTCPSRTPESAHPLKLVLLPSTQAQLIAHFPRPTSKSNISFPCPLTFHIKFTSKSSHTILKKTPYSSFTHLANSH